MPRQVPFGRQQMKTRNWWVAAWGVWMLTAGAIFAQAKAAPDKGTAKKAAKPKPFVLVKKPDGKPLLSYELAKIAEALKLDEAQQRLVADSVEVARLAVEDWKKTNDAKVKELEAQRQKLYEQRNKLGEQVQALSREYYRLQGVWRTKVAEVLTADQMAEWIRHQFGEPLRHYPTTYKFTEEQKTKARALQDAAVRKALAMPLEQRRAAMAKMAEDLRQAVRALVTPEQRKQRGISSMSYYVRSHLRRAKLTKEQEGQVAALVTQEAGEAAKRAERVAQLYKELEDLRKRSAGSSAFYREVVEKAKKTILTDPQRAALAPKSK